MNREAEAEGLIQVGEGCVGAGYLRFVLMAFVCFWSLGFPEPTGIVTTISGFAIPSFYILSGYFILVEDRMERFEKYRRKILRSLFLFLFLCAFYAIANTVLFIAGNISFSFSLRTVFNFLVLNLWPLPIGSNIWFVQAALIAYLLIALADRLGLMRFYKVALVLTMVFMLLTGELAGVIHLNLFGYGVIPGNWLTRAIPYILLGKFLREKRESLKKVPRWVYPVLWVLGAGLTVGEILLLGRTGNLVYQGHMFGFGVMAVAACSLAVTSFRETGPGITFFDSAMSGIIYIFMDPLYYGIGMLIGSSNLEYCTYVSEFLALGVSVLLAFALRNTFLARWFFTNREPLPEMPGEN